MAAHAIANERRLDLPHQITPIAGTEHPPADQAPLVGTLTFLLTDIVGSTLLWERHEAAMRHVLARHDALLDAVITTHGGQRVHERGEGDSIFAVFADPVAAVKAALAIQQALLAEPWPDEIPIQVRMGLHTGVAHFREGDYYGPVVNRCARLRGLGHGGQVLLAEATAALVANSLPPGAALRALGAHSLKGVAEPQIVYQLLHPTLPADFPPLTSPQAPRHNLPTSLTGLIGRERELADLLALLGKRRLVTLVGTGGVGKTRLAMAAAGELVSGYPDGVWLVELASLAEGALVPGATAHAVSVREEPGRPLSTTLAEALRDKRLLLVMDNCEHLVDACAELASTLLGAAPGLSILATSREGLRVVGEQLYRVPSLAIPELDRPPDIAALGQVETVQLFLERARARRADFALDATNAAAVARICARLDGIPLAIELAAARVGSLPLAALAARLDQAIGLLSGGPRTAASRQQTLRGALDWSWALLTTTECVLLQRLSVFAGGWTSDAAEAVCAGEGIEDWEVLDLLGALEGKSLLLLEERAEAGARYRLLEPTRQYAAEHLSRAGGERAVRARHLAYFLALAEEAEPALRGPEQGTWMVTLETEHDNLRGALAWSLAGDGSADQGVQLAGALWRFWHMRGYLREGRDWLERALERGRTAAGPILARALTGAGILARAQGDYARATAAHEEALALRRDLADALGVAGSLSHLGTLAMYAGDSARAQALFEEALAGIREHGDTWNLAILLNNLALAAMYQGDYARAQRAHEEALALWRALGDDRGIAGSLDNLGLLAQLRGEFVQAARLHEESLALHLGLHDKSGQARSLGNLGLAALAQGDHRRAASMLADCLSQMTELGDRWGIASTLEAVARLDRSQGHPCRSTKLWGAADALRQTIGATRPPSEQTESDQEVAGLRMELGEHAYAAAWAEGHALSLDEAIAAALAACANSERI